MKDVYDYPQSDGPYECLQCGQITRDADAGTCPTCSGELRNRLTPIE